MDGGVSITESGCRNLYIRQRVQESPLLTVDAVVFITDTWYKSLYIRVLVQESPYQMVGAGAVSILDGVGWSLDMIQRIQESLYQTVGAVFSIPDSGVSLLDSRYRSLYVRPWVLNSWCRSICIRQWLQKPLYHSVGNFRHLV